MYPGSDIRTISQVCEKFARGEYTCFIVRVEYTVGETVGMYLYTET
jgi:hypothetical protein